MHKKLFLSSYLKEVAALLPECAGELSGKRVVFIPAASVVEKVAFFVKSGKRHWKNWAWWWTNWI